VLSVGVWVAMSVATRLGWKSVGFSDVAERGQAGSRRTGTGCTLWMRWAARWRHTGMGGRQCTATLERNWLGELVRWVKTVLVAR
jgi:hypothetical protein